MNQSAVKYILCGLAIPLLVFAGLWLYDFKNYVVACDRTELKNEIGKPYAVLTIDYGEPPKGFIVGEFYVLKVLRVNATSIDYGFCPVKRETFYDKKNN